jgi:hypothetical protein
MRIRRGVTLVEALIAIFLTAIGLLAILTLFPLGALKMAEAIKADRAAYAAAKGQSLAVAMDVRHDPLIYNPNAAQPFDLFINPLPPPNPPNPMFPDLSTLPGYDGGGYPVYIDAVGWGSNMFTPVGQYVNAPFASYGLTRSSASYAMGGPQTYLPWFSLLDDLQFENDGPASGLAKGTPAGPPLNLRRNTRFSWAYLLRRPRYSVPSVVELSVVLYDKRPIQAPSSELTYAPGALPGSNLVTVGATEVILTYTSAADKPPIKKGGWILDATVFPTSPSGPDMQGVFYRVVDITDLPGNQLALELDKPIRAGWNQPVGTQVSRVFVILEGVIDVIEKGPGWKP